MCDWADGCEHRLGDILDDGVGVGSRGVDDANASRSACFEIDVVEPDACAGDDAEAGRTIEQLGIDDGVGAHNKGVCIGELVEQLGAIESRGVDELNALGEPIERLACDGFGHDDDGLGHGEES